MSKLGVTVRDMLDKKGLMAVKVVDEPTMRIYRKGTKEKVTDIDLVEFWVNNTEEYILKVIQEKLENE